MGTTATAITTQGGVKLTFVVAIEGYESLIATDTTGVATAWAATDWTAAIGGLQILGDVTQTLEPWTSTPEVPRLSFAVQPAADTAAGDAFGRLVFGSGAGSETFLAAAIDCNDATISVLSSSAWGASGTLHIGCEQVAFTGNTGTSFTGCVRGKYAPFKAESEASQRFGRAHRLPVVGEGVTISPKVTKQQRQWIGRWVGVWAHRDVGGTLDTRAQAQLIFAGRITNLRDEGLTYVDCDDMRGALRDCVLMRDQWTARVAEGVTLAAGWRFHAQDAKASTDYTGSTDLVVVPSGASGANQINAGLTKIDDLITAINTWLAAEKTAARLGLFTTLEISGGLATWTSTGGTADAVNYFSIQMTKLCAVALGWPQNGASFEVVWLEGGTGSGWWTTAAHSWSAPDEPLRVCTDDTSTITVEDVRGTWFNNKQWLPVDLGVTLAHASIVQVGDGGPCAVYQYTAPGTLTPKVHNRTALEAISGVPWDGATFNRVPYSQSGGVRLRQVAMLYLRFTDALTDTMASTGVADYNYNGTGLHGDYLPAQLGAAIPWELLGTAWLSSVNAIDQGLAPLLLVIDKPTKWTEVMGADLAARMVNLVWKNGGLLARTWGTPTAAHSLHAFAEASKATPAGTIDSHRTVADVSAAHLINVVKLHHDRSGNDYRSSVTLVDPSSQEDHGAKPVEISLRNTFGGIESTNSAIADIADGLAQTMTVFSRPLHVLRRTIGMPYFLAAPGDFCTISDSFARSLTTGQRGLSSVAGLIVRHRVDWGGYEIDTGGVRAQSGEVDILLPVATNITAYSPSADLASYAGSTITCAAHAYSESTEAVDASHFVAGDRVYIHEVDPDDPASFLAWSRTVSSVSSNDIVLTAALSSPAYDAAKAYRVVSDTYSTAVASQQADVYQADDADGMIADTINAYAYGNDPEQASTWTEAVSSTPAALYSNTQYGDGRPLSTGAERDLARLANNLVNHRTAPVLGSLHSGTAMSYTGAGRKIIDIQPVYLGPGDLILGERYARIGAWARSSDGTSCTLTISLCKNPPIGTSLTSTDTDAMLYWLTSVYESWTSGAITSTSYALVAHDFSFRSVSAWTGIAYVVVEATTKAEYRGLAQIHALAYDEDP